MHRFPGFDGLSTMVMHEIPIITFNDVVMPNWEKVTAHKKTAANIGRLLGYLSLTTPSESVEPGSPAGTSDSAAQTMPTTATTEETQLE